MLSSLRIKVACVLFVSLSELIAQNPTPFIQDKEGYAGSIVFAAGPGCCIGDPEGFPFNQNTIDGLHNYGFSMGYKRTSPGDFSYKASLAYGNYAMSDNHDASGFSFKSQVLQVLLLAEYSLLNGHNYRFKPSYDLYVFSGGGMMNSAVDFTGNTHAGDVVQTTDIAPVFHVGVGYQYQFFTSLSLGAELGWQYFFSDFVDGIATVGSHASDALTVLNFTMTYTLGGHNNVKRHCNCER